MAVRKKKPVIDFIPPSKPTQAEPEPRPLIRSVGSSQSVTMEVRHSSAYGIGHYYIEHHMTPDEADALARELHDKAAAVRRGWSPDGNS